MTREEAIAELNVLHERLSNPKDCEDGCYSWEDGWYVEAIDMAIEALQREDAETRFTHYEVMTRHAEPWRSEAEKEYIERIIEEASRR